MTVLPPLAEQEQLEALRRGDERAFAALVDAHAPRMLRVAMLYVRDKAVAEEVVQEAWLGALKSLEQFEGRSSFKTWLYRILTNIAMSRGEREARVVPFATLAGEGGDEGPAVDPSRFLAEGRWAGHWATPPERYMLSKYSIGSAPPGFSRRIPSKAGLFATPSAENGMSTCVHVFASKGPIGTAAAFVPPRYP